MTVEARARSLRCPSCGAAYRKTRHDGQGGRCPFDASVLEEVADTLVGTSLGGLDLVELIGVGAASTVYGARRTGTTGDPTLAVKVLRADLAEGLANRTRFLREARAAMRIRHDAVATMLGTSADEAVPAYLVMERLVGVSLAERIERSGAPSISDARRIATRIAAGLAAAHAVGVAVSYTHLDVYKRQARTTLVPSGGAPLRCARSESTSFSSEISTSSSPKPGRSARSTNESPSSRRATPNEPWAPEAEPAGTKR